MLNLHKSTCSKSTFLNLGEVSQKHPVTQHKILASWNFPFDRHLLTFFHLGKLVTDVICAILDQRNHQDEEETAGPR